MSEQNYLTPSELRAVADYCEALAPLWDALTSGPRGGISIDSDAHVLELAVHDANGERQGRITWGDDGAVFYPEPSGG